MAGNELRESTFYDRALAAFRLQRYKLACSHLLRELANNPQNAMAMALLGSCFLNLGQPRQALEQAKKATATDPSMDYGHYVTCLCYMEESETLEAEMAIEDALQLAPANPDYLSTFAALRFQQLDWEGGLKLLAEALERNPEHLFSLHQKHYALQRTNRKADAEAVRLQILRINPQDARMHASSGWAALESPVPEAASTHFAEALRLSPNETDYAKGLLEAEYHETAIARIYAKCHRFQKVGLVLCFVATVLLLLLTWHFKPATMSPLTALLAGFAPMLLFLCFMLVEIINRGVYYALLMFNENRRRTLMTDNLSITVFGVTLVIAICFGYFGIRISLPSWLYADWLPILGERYIPLIPLLFLGTVVAALWSLCVCGRALLRKEPPSTTIITAAYAVFVCIVVLCIFLFVALTHPGQWFLIVIIAIEMSIIVIPTTKTARKRAKEMIRNGRASVGNTDAKT